MKILNKNGEKNRKELTIKQMRIQNEMQPLLKTAPWILRVTERKDFTGPVLEVCELEISQPPGIRGESEKMIKCKICGSPAKMVKTNLGYFVECEKNGHIHNAGIYPNTHICKTPEQAEKEWDKFNK